MPLAALKASVSTGPLLPSVRGSATVAEIASGTSVTVNKPALVSAGDLILAFAYASSWDSGANSWGIPTGFSLAAGVSGRSCFVKVATGSEPSTYAFTKNGGGATVMGVIMVVIAGGSAGPNGQSGNATGPSITLASPGLLLAFGAAFSASVTIATPSGMTPVLIDNNATAPSLALFSQVVPAGATGTRALTSANATIMLGIVP